MTDSDRPRIVFADELVRLLHEERGWLGELRALLAARPESNWRIESTFENLARRSEDAIMLIAETSERYPEVIERCPVVLECTCPSLATIHALHLATSSLVEDIRFELEDEQRRVWRTSERRRERRSLERFLHDHRPAGWEGRFALADIARGLESLREELGAAPLAACNPCGTRDVFGTAPGDADVASAAGPGPAWLASADTVVAQLKRARSLAAVMIEREQGLRATSWFMLNGKLTRPAFEHLEEKLGDLVDDLDGLLEEVRAVRPGVLESWQVAIPCTCPSLTTLRGLSRAARALGKVTQSTLTAGELASASHSAADRKRLERLAGASLNNSAVPPSLDWIERECGHRDFARCDRCSADDLFRRVAAA